MHVAALRSVSVAIAFTLAASTFHPAPAAAYVGVAWVRNEVKGEFDDTLVLAGADALYDVPRVDPGTGFRLALGGGSDEVVFELSYALSRHRAPGALRPEGYPTRLHLVGLDLVVGTGLGKALTANHGRVYVRLGVTASYLRINGSGYDASPTPFDVEFQGGGFALGSGLSVKVSPHLQPFIEYDYRWLGYRSVNSRGHDIDLEEKLSGPGSGVIAGLNLTLPRRK